MYVRAAIVKAKQRLESSRLSKSWEANGPNVAIGVFEHNVSPSVREIRGCLQNLCPGGLRPAFRSVGVDAHDAQLRPGSTRTRSLQAFEARMVIIRVVGMKHEVDALQI